MNIEEYTTKIQEKLGKEEAGKIADDIASLLTYDNKIQKDIKSKDEVYENIRTNNNCSLNKLQYI